MKNKEIEVKSLEGISARLAFAVSNSHRGSVTEISKIGDSYALKVDFGDMTTYCNVRVHKGVVESIQGILEDLLRLDLKEGE